LSFVVDSIEWWRKLDVLVVFFVPVAIKAADFPLYLEDQAYLPS